MELDEFIEATLRQILLGVTKAQAIEGGENVNARFAGKDIGGNLMNAGQYGMFTRVDFDVVVSGETTKKGGANLKVLGLGLEGGGEHKAEIANRINFSVPVRIPDGDMTTAENISKQKRERASASRANTSTTWKSR